MNINLKQPEIEAALRQYIGRKLDLRNSTLAIVFNMGRGDNGLSANLTIEDVSIPGFTDADDKDVDVAKTVLTPAGSSAAVKAMLASGLTPVSSDTDSKTDAATAEVKPAVAVEVKVEAAAAPIAEKPAEVGVTVTSVVAEATATPVVNATAAVVTAEPEAVQAAQETPVAEAKTAEAPAKATTSLFG